MISLYEGILRGMEDTLETGDVEIAVIAANEPDSEIRKMFSGSLGNEPFSVSEENGKKVFTVSPSGYNGAWIECDAMKLSDTFSGIETVKVVGGARIIAPNNNIAENVCSTIVGDAISVHRATEVKDVNLIVKQLSGSKFIPNIQFDQTVEKVTNCNIEVNYNASTVGRVIFYNLPELNNVSSNTARYIDITDNPIRINGIKPNDLMGNKKFKKLFDFGYTLSYSDDHTLKTEGSVAIKDMKGLRKLITSKDFYNREFAEWPYRLKKGVKLTDFIDVSQFTDLRSIMIADAKMGIVFENTNAAPNSRPAVTAYFVDMLKQTWNSKIDGHTRSTIERNIPTTADGWRVIIFRR